MRPQYLRQGSGHGSAGLKGSVSLVERLGNETIVSFRTASGEQASAVIPEDRIFAAGSVVEFSFDPKSALLFPSV